MYGNESRPSEIPPTNYQRFETHKSRILSHRFRYFSIHKKHETRNTKHRQNVPRCCFGEDAASRSTRFGPEM